jgi:hypothetical protein
MAMKYDENKNDSIDEAVSISKQPGGLVYLLGSVVKPESLRMPAEVYIKVIRAEKQHVVKGILRHVASAKELSGEFLQLHRRQRPSAWQKRDSEGASFKTALFIVDLFDVPEPKWMKGLNLQRPVYK